MPLRAPAHKGFADWAGADVVLATGWETVYPALLLPGCRARAYLVQDHEPEFFATSAESRGRRAPTSWASTGSPPAAGCAICSPERYGMARQLVSPRRDHGIYRPPTGTATLRHRHLLRPRVHAPSRRAARGAGPRGASPAPAADALRALRPSRGATAALRVRAARRDQPRGPVLALRGGHGGSVPVAHQLLTDPAGDDGLRTPLRGPGRRLDRGRDRARRRGRDRRGRPRGDRRRARGAAGRRRRAGGGASSAGLAFVETASWDVAAKQVEAGLREALREREVSSLP